MNERKTKKEIKDKHKGIEYLMSVSAVLVSSNIAFSIKRQIYNSLALVFLSSVSSLYSCLFNMILKYFVLKTFYAFYFLKNSICTHKKWAYGKCSSKGLDRKPEKGQIRGSWGDPEKTCWLGPGLHWGHTKASLGWQDFLSQKITSLQRVPLFCLFC